MIAAKKRMIRHKQQKIHECRNRNPKQSNPHPDILSALDPIIPNERVTRHAGDRMHPITGFSRLNKRRYHLEP